MFYLGNEKRHLIEEIFSKKLSSEIKHSKPVVNQKQGRTDLSHQWIFEET